jgi:hypothetical protein
MVWYGLGLKASSSSEERSSSSCRGRRGGGGGGGGSVQPKAGAAAWSSEVSEARAGARAVVVEPGDSFTTH